MHGYSFYVEVMKKLKRRIKILRLNIDGNWKLHHNNAPSHTCCVVSDYLAWNGIVKRLPILRIRSGSGGLFLFLRVKTTLEKHGNRTVVEVFRKMTSRPPSKRGLSLSKVCQRPRILF